MTNHMGELIMLNANELLREGIKQVKAAGIEPGYINPNVKINSRAKTRFGMCRKTPGKYDYEIELNSQLLKADKSKAMNTMVHEILHSVKGCMNHGRLWTRNSEIMNEREGYDISRLSSYSKLGLERPKAKYVIQCVDCDNQILRFKRSKVVTHINNYACGACSGKLELI